MDNITNKNIADIREDYRMFSLNEEDVGECPFSFFEKWFDEAQKSQITEVNAMSLATISKDGTPHLRTVLLKGLEENSFVFFTNYQSQKGQNIAHNQNVALLFFWKELERQVRIEGKAVKLSEEASIAYFNSRPKESRLGAIASPQSQKIANRTVLEEAMTNLQVSYQDNENIEKPAHWGGYKVIAQKIEFWQGRSNRLHDRIVFEQNHSGKWDKYRIAP